MGFPGSKEVYRVVSVSVRRHLSVELYLQNLHSRLKFALCRGGVFVPRLLEKFRKESTSEVQVAALIQKQSEMISLLKDEVEALRVKVYRSFND